MVNDNPHPLWRQERCVFCKAGVRKSAHLHVISGEVISRWPSCTAPTEAEYIAQLSREVNAGDAAVSALQEVVRQCSARIAELEKDRARLEFITTQEQKNG